jgi:hypothetical protein
MLEFEDELFDEYENTLNYHMMRKPQEFRNPPSIKSLDLLRKISLKRQRRS